MAKTVRIDDELMEVIDREAEMMSRSLARQSGTGYGSA